MVFLRDPVLLHYAKAGFWPKNGNFHSMYLILLLWAACEKENRSHITVVEGRGQGRQSSLIHHSCVQKKKNQIFDEKRKITYFLKKKMTEKDENSTACSEQRNLKRISTVQKCTEKTTKINWSLKKNPICDSNMSQTRICLSWDGKSDWIKGWVLLGKGSRLLCHTWGSRGWRGTSQQEQWPYLKHRSVSSWVILYIYNYIFYVFIYFYIFYISPMFNICRMW